MNLMTAVYLIKFGRERSPAMFLTVLLFTCIELVKCEDVVSKFFSDYDRSVRPDFDEGIPTTIWSDLYVESFGNIEEANMEYRVYIYFRQQWKDPRLAGKLNRSLTINKGDIENMWVPDPYCYNARESNMMMPDEEVHSSVNIGKDGDVFYSKGVTLLASCLMDLRHFPLDSQTCYLKFGSYSYSTSDLIFKWSVTDINVGTTEMAQFNYKGAELTSNVDVFSVGNYSTITVTFKFERRIGYYLIQVYFPDMFVVALSWIVFWMDKDDMGNRMALGITTILTIMFLLGSLSGTLPKVSYAKALDWYLMISFGFVFLSLVECMVVFVFTINAKSEKIKCKSDEKPLSRKITTRIKSAFGSRNDVDAPKERSQNNGVPNMGSEDDLEMVYRAAKLEKTVVDDGTYANTNLPSNKERIADSIDKMSRVLFPLAFLIYNIFYWSYY